MITKAWVTLQYGRVTVQTMLSDPHGIKSFYFLNLDGSTKQWNVVKIERATDAEEQQSTDN